MYFEIGALVFEASMVALNALGLRKRKTCEKHNKKRNLLGKTLIQMHGVMISLSKVAFIFKSLVKVLSTADALQ
jgi:hypothetical protein